MKYGIAIFPSQEVQERANNLRKRYDSHYDLIPPHITIKETFELDDVDQAVKHVDEVTSKIPPFSLRINKVKTFLPTSPVIFFALEDNPLIYKLHEEINSGILFHEKKFKFIPHITVAQDLATQELHDIYNRLSLKEFDTSFTVESVYLLYQTENGSWTNYQTFHLRGQK